MKCEDIKDELTYLAFYNEIKSGVSPNGVKVYRGYPFPKTWKEFLNTTIGNQRFGKPRNIPTQPQKPIVKQIEGNTYNDTDNDNEDKNEWDSGYSYGKKKKKNR